MVSQAISRPGSTLSDKHRRLAQHLAEGESYAQAYKSAGYDGPFPYGEAGRILTPEFKYYLFWLREQIEGRTFQSVELLIKQLDDARLLAMVDRQVPAAVAAIMAKAKLLGYLIDKAEIEMHILNKPSRQPTEVVDLSVEEWQAQYEPPKLQ